MLLRVLPGWQDHCPKCSHLRSGHSPCLGHVAISEDRRMVRVYQKRAKTDQFGRGTEVFFESTDDELCPVRALISLCGPESSRAGSVLLYGDRWGIDQGALHEAGPVSHGEGGYPSDRLLGPQLPDWGGDSGVTSRGAGLIQALGRWSSSAFFVISARLGEQLTQYSNPISRRV